MALPLIACSSSGPPPAEAPASAPAEERSEDVASTAPDSKPGLLPPSAPAAPAAEATTPKDARGKDEIQRVVADNRDKVRACYDAALKENPGIQGDLVVTFVIDPAGNVKSAEVNWAESELHVPELDTCAVEIVKALKFPASSRGLESKVNYPFNFNPAPPDRPEAASPTPSSGPR